MAKGIIVDLIKKYGPNGILHFFDIDFTLCNTMDTNTTAEQKAAILELYYRTGGGIVFATGRSSAGVDATFSGSLPGSYEHHSAMRIKQGRDIIALAPKVNTAALAGFAKDFINSQIQIAENPEQVRQAEGQFSCVYPEVKTFALALVHSVGHNDVENDRVIIERAAQHALEMGKISHSHKIAKGSDAIEIVPKGLDENSLVSQFMNAQQIGHLKAALNKATAVRNFMSLPDFEDRTPFFWGDSGTDGKGMVVVKQEYNGAGIWVRNGKPVPDEYANVVDQTLSNYFKTWGEIEAANQFLRDHSRIVILPNPPKEIVVAQRMPS